MSQEESFLPSHFHYCKISPPALLPSFAPWDVGQDAQAHSIFFFSNARDLANLWHCWAETCSQTCLHGPSNASREVWMEAAPCPANPFPEAGNLGFTLGFFPCTPAPSPPCSRTPLLQQMTQSVYRAGKLIESRQNSSLSGTALHTDKIILSSAC